MDAEKSFRLFNWVLKDNCSILLLIKTSSENKGIWYSSIKSIWVFFTEWLKGKKKIQPWVACTNGWRDSATYKFSSGKAKSGGWDCFSAGNDMSRKDYRTPLFPHFSPWKSIPSGCSLEKKNKPSKMNIEKVIDQESFTFSFSPHKSRQDYSHCLEETLVQLTHFLIT